MAASGTRSLADHRRGNRARLAFANPRLFCPLPPLMLLVRGRSWWGLPGPWYLAPEGIGRPLGRARLRVEVLLVLVLLCRQVWLLLLLLLLVHDTTTAESCVPHRSSFQPWLLVRESKARDRAETEWGTTSSTYGNHTGI